VHGVLLMNAKWIAVTVGVVIVALAVWFSAADADGATEALAGGNSANAELVASTADPAPDAGRSSAENVQRATPRASSAAAVEPFVTVRSSIGLPLPFVDVQDELEDWQRAELDHDRCALDPAIALPRLLRAPGHVPKLVTRFGEELVLEPDMLLTLEADGLRTRTRSIRIDDRWSHGERPLMPEMRQAVAFGFLSDDRWCVAASHDLLRAAVFRGELDVTVLWPDHQRADVHVRIAPGARVGWTVPVDRGARGAPLRLHVRRPAEEPPGDVSLTVNLPHEGDEAIWEQFAWGRVAIYDPRQLWLDAQKLEAGSSDYTFDFLPTGVPLILGAHDRTTCAYGRMSVVHDGTDRTLDLRPAFVLRGSLLSAEDRTPVGPANFTWEFRDEPDTRADWRCEKFPLRTDPAGRFEARGPRQITLHEVMALDRPSRLFIEIEAPGFERFERAVDTAGAQTFDCGELLLTPRAAELTLAPGHGVTPETIAWMQLRVSSMPDVYWDVRGSGLNADGSMLISIMEAEGSTRDRRLLKGRRLGSGEDVRLPWPSEPGRWLTIHMLLGDRDETRLFERRTDGGYAPVPRREVVLDLKCGAIPAGVEWWHLGWQLDEQWGFFGVDVPGVVGESSRVRFSVPVGASLWWSPQQTPPGLYGASADVGGSMPIESVPERFILR
jgi:hypothetical protein